MSNTTNQQFASKSTSLKNNRPACIKLGEKRGLWNPSAFKVNFDLGGGRTTKLTKYLKSKGISNMLVDPFHVSEEDNEERLAFIHRNDGADTGTLSNVLNVIKEKDIRLAILNELADYVKRGATCIITVYAGSKANRERGGRQTTKDSWQNFATMQDLYLEEIHETERFEVIHFTQTHAIVKRIK